MAWRRTSSSCLNAKRPNLLKCKRVDLLNRKRDQSMVSNNLTSQTTANILQKRKETGSKFSIKVEKIHPDWMTFQVQGVS